MPASVTDLITKTFDTTNPNVALVTSTRVIGSTELQADNLAGWPDLTAVHFMTYQIDSENMVIPGSQTDWKGIVNKSSNKIVGIVRQAGAVDDGNSINDVIEAGPTASWSDNLAEALLKTFKPDGSINPSATLAKAISDLSTPLATRREYFGTEATFNIDPARYGWLFMEKDTEYPKATYQRLYNHMKAVDAASVKSDTGTTFMFADKWFGTVPVSVDASQTEFDTLGKSVGHKDLQKHSHTLRALVSNGDLNSTSTNSIPVRAGTSSGAFGTNVLQNGIAVETGAGDSGNLQPSLILNHVIKY